MRVLLLIVLLPLASNAYTICLDPGHGGDNPGATGIYYLEKDANLDCAHLTHSYLERVEEIDWIGLTRVDDSTVSLYDRVAYANANGFDRFISLHHNAFNTAIQGTETYCHPGGSTEAFDLRNEVHPELIWAFGYDDRGIKTADFYVLRNTIMPAILAEASFIDYHNGYDESWRFANHWEDHDGREGFAYHVGLCDHMGSPKQNYGDLASDNGYYNFFINDDNEWGSGSYGDPFGWDYAWSDTGDGDDWARWEPYLPRAGTYDLYAYWVEGTNRASDALFTVHDNGGDTDIRVDQTVNGEQWNLLGQFEFDQGFGGYITLSDNGCAPGAVVIADAVLFEWYDPSDVDDKDSAPRNPVSFALHPVYPNPSSGSTIIEYVIPYACEVELAVYDIKGRKVATLVEGEVPPGEYTAEVSGLSSGVYLYRLTANDFSDTRKMVVK